MKTQALIEYFNRIHPLDEKEIAFVEEVFKERRIKKTIYSSRRRNL